MMLDLELPLSFLYYEWKDAIRNSIQLELCQKVNFNKYNKQIKITVTCNGI